jgi:hypothetical protein
MLINVNVVTRPGNTGFFVPEILASIAARFCADFNKQIVPSAYYMLINFSTGNKKGLHLHVSL